MPFQKRIRQQRLTSKELNNFKFLVFFVFLVYGIVLPLWFAYYGQKFLHEHEKWVDVVISSTRSSTSKYAERKEMNAKSNNKHTDDYGKYKINRKMKAFKSNKSRISSIARKDSSKNGRILAMKWDHLCCQSVNCLRKYPLFPLLPSSTSYLRNLSVLNTERLFGQRIFGRLSPATSGIHSFWVKCMATCELWLSEGEYHRTSKLFIKVVHGLAMNISEHQQSFDTELYSNKTYFIDILYAVYRPLAHPLEILWKLPNNDNYTLITEQFFAGFSKKHQSLKTRLKLFSSAPGVHLTPFLAAIEEQGEDDEDFQAGVELPSEVQLLDKRGMVVPLNASFYQWEFLSPIKHGSPSGRMFKSCDYRPSYLVDSSLPMYGGVWKTLFSSVFPNDNTGHMMCIGNRYPVDCQGNKVIPHKTIQRLLTLYTDALSKHNIQNAKKGNDISLQADTGLKVSSLVSVREKKDPLKGTRFLLDVVLADVRSNLTFFQSEYLYMHKDSESLCSPRGFVIDFYVTVYVLVVAKRQPRWLRYFLTNMERIFINTDDQHLKIIIAKYGKDDGDLKDEYRRSRLPSIRTVRQFGRFHKTKAIQSAVDAIHDENSIIFLMDLHILVPNTMISLVRKHTIKGKMVFNPVLFRLSHCGSPASSRKAPQGFWETFGYGIIGIYKSDWDRIGGMSSKKYSRGWGGEDWELLDRILSAGLEVERLRLPNFYHFHHSKKNLWN